MIVPIRGVTNLLRTAYGKMNEKKKTDNIDFMSNVLTCSLNHTQ